MPGSEAAKVEFKTRQDGLAVYVTVNNNSKLLVSSVSFDCHFFDPSRSRPQSPGSGLPWCAPGDAIVVGSTSVWARPCSFASAVKYTEEVNLPPGKSRVVYREVGKDWAKIWQCLPGELRAREPGFLDRFSR